MRLTHFIRPLPRPVAGRWSIGLTICIWAAAVLQAQTTVLTITRPSPLPSAVVGTNYNQTIQITGGTAPFQWSVGTGFPPGLTLGPSSGVISGTPTTAGTYSFVVQVGDSTQQSSISQFALTVAAPGLAIAASTLFNGQIGSVYSASFSASGGTPPYTWSTSGNTDGLTIDSKAGVLSGTPQTAGTFNFAVIVTDSAGLTVSQNISLTINPPSLIITAGAPLPGGTAGVPYDQKFSVAVSGGAPPYTWSLISGAVPGLTFTASTVELSGTPTTAGTYTLTLQATDSSGATASRNFSLTIAPAALTIITSRQLPSGSLNNPYSQTLAASGGSPPYSWSANGLPAGLTINSGTGVISGTPAAAGNFTPVITVTDSLLNAYRDDFSIAVQLPSVPSISISGLPATAAAAQQFPLQVALGAAYSAALTGQLILSFQPTSGPTDGTIQFSTGGQSVSFSIPAGSTSATFDGGNGLAVSQLLIQTGTADGTIIVSLSNLTAAGTDVTPTPAPSVSTQISAAAPVISQVQVIRNADSTTGCLQGQICVEITGYVTDREVTQATFNFTAVTGQTLQSSAGSISVSVGTVFSTWFSTSTMGSQFIFVQPFTVTGDPTEVVCASVTLTNRVASTTATVNQ